MDSAVESLIQEYGLRRDEAVDRLQLGGEAELLGEWLYHRLPDAYGGVAVDNAKGVIRVMVTDPSLVTNMIADYPKRSRVETIAVGWSIRRLQAVRECLSQVLPAGSGESALLLGIDRLANVVTINYNDTEQGRAAIAAPAVTAQVQDSNGKIVTRAQLPAQPKGG